MRDSRSIGLRVRQARIEKNMSLRDVADKMDWSYWNYCSFENGWLLANFLEFQKLAKILGKTEKELLEPIPNDEYIKLILHTNKNLDSAELLDAIFDRIEDILRVEIARVEERLENSFINTQKELNCKTNKVKDKVKDILDEDFLNILNEEEERELLF